MSEEQKKKIDFKAFAREIAKHLGFLQLFIAAAITIHIASSKTVKDLTSWLETQYPVSKALAYSTQSKEKNILFGPQAILNCLNRCVRSRNNDTCKHRCSKFSLNNYPHRISLNDASAKEDVEQIKSLCGKENKLVSSSSEEGWYNNLIKAKQLIKLSPIKNEHYGANRLYYQRSINILNELGLVNNFQQEQETKDIANITSKTLCLNLHLALSNLGQIIAKQSEDLYNQKHYLEISEMLENELLNTNEQNVQIIETFSKKFNTENENKY